MSSTNAPAGGGSAADLVDVDRSGAAVVRVHAQPGAARGGIVGRHGDALKVKVTARPVGGRANAAVAGELASALGVAPTAVELVAGASSRRKRFRVDGVDPGAVTRALSAVLDGRAGPDRVVRRPGGNGGATP